MTGLSRKGLCGVFTKWYDITFRAFVIRDSPREHHRNADQHHSLQTKRYSGHFFQHEVVLSALSSDQKLICGSSKEVRFT